MYKLLSKVAASTATATMLVFGGVVSSGAVSVDASSTITDSDLTNAIADDGAFDIVSGPYSFLATFVRTDQAGQIVFEISNTGPTTQTVELAVNSIDQRFGSFLGGLTVGWDGAGSQSVAEGLSTSFTIATTIAAGASDFVRIAYGNLSANTIRATIDLDVATVSAVPLPPALFMLGTALFGLGFLSRRRARATA